MNQDYRDHFKKLRRSVVQQRKKRINQTNKTPWVSLSLMLLTSGFGFYAYFNFGQVEKFLNKIEIQAFGLVGAEEAKNEKKPEPGKKEAPAKAQEAEKIAAEEEEEDSSASAKSHQWTPEDINFFSKLNARKKELDRRETDLNKMEEELQQQKAMIDRKIKELSDIRAKIGGVLKEKIDTDQERVNKLVEFYSNMKADQAAKVIETLDEDLAVQILGQMKKKNAADIMNLLKADKAQGLTEKFAGYRRQ